MNVEDKRAARYRELAKLTKAHLCGMYRDGVPAPDGSLVRYLDGTHPPEQWTKDEVINSILNIEVPREDTDAQ